MQEDTGARASDQRRAHGRPRGPGVGRASDPAPGNGELLVRLRAAGVNFIDTYHRQGLYPRELPFVLGVEVRAPSRPSGRGRGRPARGHGRVGGRGVGVVRGARPCSRRSGGARPRGRAAPVAAAALLQGVTAHFLSHDTYPLARGTVPDPGGRRRRRPAARPDGEGGGRGGFRAPSGPRRRASSPAAPAPIT